MPYGLVALLIVLAIPFAAVGLVVVAIGWASDALARSRHTGLTGIACTAVAAANLFVARPCGDGTNRPVIAIITGSGDCYRAALMSFELMVLLGVATSVAVRLGDLRR